jgi:hypothetical protein
MKNIKAEFNYGGIYHVFNRSNNREKLFKEEKNRSYFLRLCRDKLLGFVDFYAYALLDNHFHLAILIKEEDQILDYIASLPFEDQKTKTLINFTNCSEIHRDINVLIQTQFSRVFNSYTQAINKNYNRKGNLFNHSIKRALIKSEPRFANLIYYIHHNSRKHNIYKNFLNDKWHSYHEIIESSSYIVNHQYVLDWFGGKEAFRVSPGKIFRRRFQKLLD